MPEAMHAKIIVIRLLWGELAAPPPPHGPSCLIVHPTSFDRPTAIMPLHEEEWETMKKIILILMYSTVIQNVLYANTVMKPGRIRNL